MANPAGVVDIKKLHPFQYSARKSLLDFEMPAATYLSASGTGRPGGKAFVAAIARLYPIVYTAKFTLKARGELDYKILPLECVWGEIDFQTVPQEEWSWKMQIQVPAQFTEEHIDLARRIVLERKGRQVEVPDLVRMDGGRCLQLLHLGPYENLHLTYSRLQAAAEERDLRFDGSRCREIYLSDPRRAKPERLKTIVRVGVLSIEL